jgi:hypothetical protein
MTFLPTVVHAEHRGGYRLFVRFNDASENTIDFEPWFEGPMFEPLRDPEYFRRFFVDGGTVIWPNGADIAPEALYDVPGRRQRPGKRLPPKKAHQSPKRRRTAATRPSRLNRTLLDGRKH